MAYTSYSQYLQQNTTDHQDSNTSLLERSPSLMSRSSGASTPPPTTPSLSSSNSSSFPANGTAYTTNHHQHAYGYKSAIPSSNGGNGGTHGAAAGAASTTVPAGHEKGLFGYQAKMLSRTGSIQSMSSMNHLPSSMSSSSGLRSGAGTPTLQTINRSSADDNGGSITSRAAKRTTWTAPASSSSSFSAPGNPHHRTPGSGSVSSFDDIKARFGGKVAPTNSSSRPPSPTKVGSGSMSSSQQTTPTWRRNPMTRSTTMSNIENTAPAPLGPSSYPSRSMTGTPDAAMSRPFSPPLGHTSTSAPSAPVESEIMRHSFANPPSSTFSSATVGHGLGHRPKMPSVHLGAVRDLGSSSVSALRNLRDFAVQGEGVSSSSGVERTFTVRGGGAANTHRRTKTLPNFQDIDTHTAEPLQQPSRQSQRDRDRIPRLNMHGLDRLSERSDGSTSSAPSSPRRYQAQHHLGEDLGHGRSPNKPPSASGRRMASDAGEEETGSIVIPGITVGSDSVAGMSGRLRLARQPTQTKYGNLPSQTMKAMDTQRQCLQAYEYLCHVSEAKEWLVSCLSQHPMSPGMGITSPDMALSPSVGMGSPTKMGAQGEGDDNDPSGLENKSVVELEEALRNGVALARLARAFMGPKAVPRIFTAPRPRFRHSDNINYYFQFCTSVGLPEVFCFELTDLYDAKNLPKVIYCIHALSHLLARRGLAERISNHIGKVDFTDEELRNKQKGLDAAGVAMPSFGNIGKQLAKEINEEPEPEPEPEETEDEIRERLLDEAEPDVIRMQALLRGHLARVRHEQKLYALQRSTYTYIGLQAQCRGKLAHRRLHDAVLERQQVLKQATGFVTRFQAHSRKVLVQRKFFANIAQLDQHDEGMTGFQALVRGKLARERYNDLLFGLSETFGSVIGLQAHIRGVLARRFLLSRVRRLQVAEKQVAGFQSVIRGVLARKAQAKVVKDMKKVEVVRSVGNVQAFARGALMRKRQQQQSKALGFVLPDVVGVQAQVRGFIARRRFWSWHSYLDSCQEEATQLQALLLGAMARKKFWTRLAHYHHHMDKVIKVQAIFRKKQQLEQYRQLTKGTNVPLSTVKNFIHLLSDNDNDYREEVEVEQLKKTVVTKIRANQQLEADVSDLDIKIALLVKNKMSIDEVERARRNGAPGTLGHKQRNSVLAAAKDPFALASMDKATLRKLELYQQMFYLLQTKPEYLARLFYRLSQIDMGDRARKAMEGVVLTLFGYAQNNREEFLLLKLFQRSILEEVYAINSPQDFVTGNFVVTKLVMQYGRGAKERKFLQDLLSPLVRDIISVTDLDLETDPMAIYRATIAREEMETGLTSQRPLDGITPLQASQDPESRTIFIRNLVELRKRTDPFLSAICASTARMPFGMRYIARELFRALEVKFGANNRTAVLRVVGHFLYYRYINPAIVAPESFDVVSETIGPAQRKNLAAISKMLNQISVGQQFAEEDLWFTPLNQFVDYGAHRFRDWFYQILDVPDAEAQFNADEYLDHSLPHKPIIYISPNEIYSMHTLVLQNMDAIASGQRDPLRMLVGELGGAPLPASAELDQARQGEIAMTLRGRFEQIDDPRTDEKALFAATKRYVLYLLKVQPGDNLLQALVAEVTRDHEDAWSQVLHEELAVTQARQSHSSPNLNGSAMEDLSGLSFRHLKARCLENLLKLEEMGRVKRTDNFQDVLNAVATDIRNKHRKRIVRQREIHAMEGTITNLDDKRKYLEQQLDAFRSFVDSTKTTIQKKGKRRLVIPFSAQYFHERELARTGRKPKFGSYKYTAKNLADKGILLSIEGFSPRQYDQISLTISSDEVGIFLVEASFIGVPSPDGPVEISMDELLQAQFNAKQTLNLGGMAKCNLNLLLSLINKKFYS